jgi:hypothetical protein
MINVLIQWRTAVNQPGRLGDRAEVFSQLLGVLDVAYRILGTIALSDSFRRRTVYAQMPLCPAQQNSFLVQSAYNSQNN